MDSESFALFLVLTSTSASIGTGSPGLEMANFAKFTQAKNRNLDQLIQKLKILVNLFSANGVAVFFSKIVSYLSCHLKSIKYRVASVKI